MEDARKAQLKNLFDLIDDIRFGMMSTIGEDGAVYAQPMTTLMRGAAREADEALYFFVSRSGAAFKAVGRNPNFNVSYANIQEGIYVSITAVARIVEDEAVKKDLFSLATRVWFPEGVDDPDLGLIRLDIDAAEVWDIKESKISQILKLIKASVTGEKPADFTTYTEIR